MSATSEQFESKHGTVTSQILYLKQLVFSAFIQIASTQISKPINTLKTHIYENKILKIKPTADF